MAEINEGRPEGAGGSLWTLRLAGPQDDSNESLWAPHSRTSGFGPGGVAGVVARNRRLAAAVFLAVLLPAAAWIWTLESAHEATAQLFVSSASGGGALPPPAVAVEVGRVRSEAAVRRVAEALQLGDGDGGFEAAVERLKANLRVGSLPESGMITIQYSGADPARAADIVNTFANLYLDRAAGLRRAAEAAAAGADELRAYEQELESARGELAEFLQRNEGALRAAQRDETLSRPEQLGSDLRGLDSFLREAERRLDRARLSAQDGAAAAQAQAQIAQAQALIGELRRRREQVVEQLRTAEARRSQLQRLSARHDQLQAAVAAAEQDYNQRKAEAAPLQPPDPLRVNASMARRATAQSTRTESYERPWLLLLSVLAAACAALGAALLADPGRRPVSHVADIVTAAGVPVLIMIEETQSHVS